jgi:hypothetical protein
MKRLLIVAAICAIVAPTFASPDIMPAMKVKGYTTVGYNLATGETYPLPPQQRFGRQMWWGGYGSGYFYGQWSSTAPQDGTMDWGDIAAGSGIGGMYLALIGSQTPSTPGYDVVCTWWGDDNGFNTTTRDGLYRLTLVNMPGLPYAPPGWGSGWTFSIDFQTFGWIPVLDGNDLDGDALSDFGYSYWFNNIPAGTVVLGTLIGPYVPIGTETGGAEDAFDLYADPNLVTYWGTYWFGGSPFAQFMAQYNSTDCPNAGTTPPGVLDFCYTDIYPVGPSGDCLVNISDLGQLLPNYSGDPNAPATQTFFTGDVYPKYFGDGVVNISDLGQMLAQYNDNCN